MTNSEKSFNLQFELQAVFRAIAYKILTITADFSEVAPGQEIELSKIPLELYKIPPSLLAQAFDFGRHNATIQPADKYDVNIFDDDYHRDAINIRSSIALVQSSSIITTDNLNYKAIPIVDFLNRLLIKYISHSNVTKEGQEFNLSTLKRDHSNFKTASSDYYLSVPKELVDNVIKKLGRIGALRNRDWQMESYVGSFGCKLSAEEKRHYPLKLMQIKYKDKFPSDVDELKLTILPEEISETQSYVISMLEAQMEETVPDPEKEQRYFYYDVLYNLLNSIVIKNETALDKNHKIQLQACFKRIADILVNCPTLSYPSFLRSIEVCISEVSVLLIIKNIISPSHLLERVYSLKEFITAVIGKKPEMVTLRSSAMQSIWSAFFIALDFHHLNFPEEVFNLFVPKTTYFEINLVLEVITHIKRDFQDVSVSFDKNFNSEMLPHSCATIYDLFIGSFESNVQVIEDGNQFTNINEFVANQLRLRKEKDLTERKLFIIIDNTMSSFDQIYLPNLLSQFKEDIDKGMLCVLVAHSGNKYLHVGTDIELGSLLYGYYDRFSFPKLGLSLGDFSKDDPTVLLTEAFLTHCIPNILQYHELIKQRAYYLYNNIIPDSLRAKDNYVKIESPILTVTDPLLLSQQEEFKNSWGFLNFKILKPKLMPLEIHNALIDYMWDFLSCLGILSRDGFGFSQTTVIRFDFEISEKDIFYKNIRVSIGTEALTEITTSLELFCNMVVKINNIVKDCDFKEIEDVKKTKLLADMKSIFDFSVNQYKMLAEDSPKHAKVLCC